jgi:hypothetical protein
LQKHKILYRRVVKNIALLRLRMNSYHHPRQQGDLQYTDILKLAIARRDWATRAGRYKEISIAILTKDGFRWMQHVLSCV